MYCAKLRYVGTSTLFWEINTAYSDNCGPGSSDGIATGHGLDGPGIESR